MRNRANFIILLHKRSGLSVIIFRYLTKEILGTMVATILVLMIIFITNQFVHYLNVAASGKLTIHAVVLVMMTQIPMFLGYLLPLGFFLAILLTLGRLCVDHEMVVLSSCGVSRAQIVRMIMSLALVLTLVDAWLMLVVEPKMFNYRTQIVLQSVQSATLSKVLPGRFQTLGANSPVLYARKVIRANKELGNVFMAFQSKSGQWSVLVSKVLEQKKAADVGDSFVFTDGYRYSGTPGQQDFQALQFKQYQVRLPSPAISMTGRYASLPTGKLIDLYAKDVAAAAELQWRICIFLSTLAFALLAVPLGEVKPRKGKFARMLPAIVIYVGYANMMFVVRSWVQQKVVPPWLGLWWIVVFLFVLAFFLYFYPTGMRYIRSMLRRRA